jgi:kinesin family member 5
MAATRDSIKVVCRIRPENAIEREGNYNRVVQFTETDIRIEVNDEGGGIHNFAFDRIFGPQVHQRDVFKTVGAPIIDGIFQGFNGTVFAYG